MLDILLSFIILFILSLKRIVAYFVFRPPKLSTYKTEIIKLDNSIQEKILLLKRGRKEYYEPNFSTVRHEYIRIPDGDSFIPIIVFKPINCFDVCIIYSHGNSCDIGISFFECLDISLNTYSCVLLYEYPGYGLCKNRKLTEEGVYYNIRKVHEYAINQLKFKSDQLILYGHSLGTGPCIDLAIDAKYPVSAVVLQAPFLSILRTVANFKKTAFCDFFPNIDKISKIIVPVLIFHGTKDRVVPFVDGLSLSKLIKSEHLYEFVKIEEGNHNDLIKNHKMILYEKLREFLNYVTKKSFSFNLNNSKAEDLNSEFFKKLHPHKGDDRPSSEEHRLDNENFEIYSNNFVIRNYIEIEINRNIGENQGLNPEGNKSNDEKFIKIEIKDDKELVGDKNNDNKIIDKKKENVVSENVCDSSEEIKSHK